MTDAIKKDEKAASEARAAEPMPKEKADYEVGYGKPPKAHRFKPGQSGNPGGRKKGGKNMRTILQEALESRITIREGDKFRTMSAREALIQYTIAQALKQNPKAYGNVMKLLKDHGEFTPEAGAAPRGGCFVLPMKPETPEEWQRIYGEAAKGAPIPQDILDQVNKLTRSTN